MASSSPVMRTVWPVWLAGVLSALLLSAACGQGDTSVKAPDPQGKAAPAGSGSSVTPEIQAAVETYLREGKGLDPSKMDIALTDFVEKDGAATCAGAITLKEGQGMPPMEYTYTFAKTDGAWKVTASQPKGGVGHAAMPPANAMPAGHPSVEGMNPHEGVAGAPPLAAGHGSAAPAPAGEAPKK